MSNQKKAEARARAKALREEDLRRERRREQLLRGGIAAGVLVVVIAAVVLFTVLSGRNDGEGRVPEGANSAGDGVTVGESSAPVAIDVWFDFQCPFCQAFEEENGEVLADAVADGRAQVTYHPAAFIGEESERAANAFACAIDAGSPVELLAELFAHQPPENSGGYTEDELIERGAAVGLTGADFESCVREGAYADWGAGAVRDGMQAADISTTPTVVVDGEVLDNAAEIGADEFSQIIDAAGNS